MTNKNETAVVKPDKIETKAIKANGIKPKPINDNHVTIDSSVDIPVSIVWERLASLCGDGALVKMSMINGGATLRVETHKEVLR
jgi:hypothetical protein